MVVSKLLSPVTTGFLLWALTKAPIRIRLPFVVLLRRYTEPETYDRILASLKWLFALGITTRASAYLSRLAESNFRLTKSKYVWNSEVAVITGAAGGFGSLMSKSLARKGVRVMALDIQDELPEDMKRFSKIHYYKCDVGDRAAVMAVAEEIRRIHGDPSILINNAGVLIPGRLLNATEETIRQTFDVNAIGHYWMVQAFLPAMIQKKKGHVVTIASMASFIATPSLGVYSASKAAAHSFHEGLRREARQLYNAPEIQFTIVHPGYAATPMIAQFKSSLSKAKSKPLSAQSVADAVVRQIESGRGRQIILRNGSGHSEYLRALPHWFSTAEFMWLERFARLPYQK